ncbi:MAG: hypothetical protein ACR2JC_05710 [Chloroflexota bacterium]
MSLSSSVRGPRAAVSGKRTLDIVRTLSPVTCAIGIGRVARGALLGFGVGALLGTAILLAAQVRAFGFTLPAAVLAAVLGLVAGSAAGVVRWPRALEAARAVDLHFHLDDRLTTALELREADTPVASLQRRDVAGRIDGLTLRKSRGQWLRRREAAMAVVATLAFAAALTLGPQGGHHRSAAAAPLSRTARVRHDAASQVRKLASKLDLGLTTAQLQSPAMRQLDLALSRLRHQLLQASTPHAGLRAISATQHQLRRLALGLHPVNVRAVAQLNSSLSRSLGKEQTRRTSASPSRSSLASAQALNRFAQLLPHLTPAQQAALAPALARAANATSSNALRSALRQAASSLANNDTRSARAALRQGAQSLSQSALAQVALARAAAAGTQLDALKNQIAGTGAAPPSLPLSARQGQPNTTGQGAGRKSGRTPGITVGSGRGRGTRPGQGGLLGRGHGAGRRGIGARRGNGRGRGRGFGQGTVATSGRATSGARGNGGLGRSRLTRNGRSVTVFVPGKQGKGAEIVRNGPQGAPAPGALVPYQQVVGQYSQSAHQALDRGALPPSLQEYVRRYFSTLSR